nr:hypothetical protein [Candidatus Enterousia merdequi]
MADYKINEFGEIVFNNGIKKQTSDPLWEEYAQLEYEVLNNHHNPTKDPVKIARYNELKKHFDIKKSEDALNKAKERIKQRIIAADKSKDNSVVYTAMSTFKKTNE